nr:YvcK family protein [Acidimicrobiia bacterium]
MNVVAVGGGHGLAVTLRACRGFARSLTAVVSVADDGGSTGRLRATMPALPAPGDLRLCLTTMASAERSLLAAALEHRFCAG